MSLEKLITLLEELKEDKRVKLVEGRSDKKALEQLGITNIKTMQGSALADLPMKTSQDIVLLTDFDRKGNEIAKRIAELFKNEGHDVDLTYREKLRKYTGVKQFEDLDKKVEQKIIESDENGKNIHRHSKICHTRHNGN